ncbi:MAG TPA: EpsI family protein [Bryobacteraceae bacterium]|nr:EpsI family protein [Bryobacteraceae bacterium]
MVAAAILAIQGFAVYALHREPYLPSPPPLSTFPTRLGNWVRAADEVMDSASLEMLGPDDLLSRRYQMEGADRRADLFVAYYRTQLKGKNAHDPKVCLPGGGWNPVESRVVKTEFSPGKTAPINYYRIEKAGAQEIVVYWFQTPTGTYTTEQELNANRLLQAIRTNRTDMALVRVIVPVLSDGVDTASRDAVNFARIVYPEILPFFQAGSGQASGAPTSHL